MTSDCQHAQRVLRKVKTEWEWGPKSRCVCLTSVRGCMRWHARKLQKPRAKNTQKSELVGLCVCSFFYQPFSKARKVRISSPVTTFRGAREVDKSKLTTNGKVNWSVKRFLGADPSGAAYPSCPDTTPDRILYCFVQFSEGTLQITLSARPRIVEVSFFQYFSSSFADAVCTDRNICNMAQGLP